MLKKKKKDNVITISATSSRATKHDFNASWDIFPTSQAFRR
jgi:hypothetical protein